MICGVDEAGRGPVMGPLVVCALAVDSDAPLVKLGVKDSKRLSPKKREELAPKIRKVAKVEIAELQAEEIDAMRTRMTMNELEAHIFAQLIDRFSPEIAYVDAADVNEKEFERMIRSSLRCRPRICSEHKADDTYPVVSAASIVAKVTRDARVREIEEEIGQPIGSGYMTDRVTTDFLKRYVEEHKCHPPHTRRSWEPAKNIMMLNSLRRLDSFEE
jgi:ribonuclease HII